MKSTHKIRITPLCANYHVHHKHGELYLEGLSFSQIKLDFIALIVLALITLPLAAWLFRNRLS
jgi:hypothetical protein